MQLPRDLILNNGAYTKPHVILCETDKTKICKLESQNLKGKFKFNSYSEISFDIARTYVDTVTGETYVHPFYDKAEAPRLVELQGMGYFEIQGTDTSADGVQEIKSLTAYSSEYSLTHKFLENFIINSGTTASIDGVVLYNQNDTEHSLLNLILVKAYGWSIGHVDDSLKKKTRTFEIDRQSVYDFLMNEVSDKYKCMVVFDTINSTINLYAESIVEKFYGDGGTTQFILPKPFEAISSITINGYKTNAYVYDMFAGEIIFNNPPEARSIIEVTDGSQEQWDTDVFVSFENIASEMNVSFSADDIKTVLTGTGGDDLTIREVNMGLPYIVDLSYYYSVEWMGQSLYDAYTVYLNKCNNYKTTDLQYRARLNELIDEMSYLNYRLSTQYAVENSVSEQTVGTYYLRGGDAPNYYYTEVTLPDSYNAHTTYYSIAGVNLNNDKLNNLKIAIQNYLSNGVLISDDPSIVTISSLNDDFSFVENYTINVLVADLAASTTDTDKELSLYAFLDEMWLQYGLSELNTCLSSYGNLINVDLNAGWSEKTNNNYYMYHAAYILNESVKSAIHIRESEISEAETEKSMIENNILLMGESLLIENNFTNQQLVRLSSFLREDEYVDDTILVTDSDSNTDVLKIKQELKESTEIELSKLCQPQLSFSMTMANIYALPAFEPIINQFQLGNLIRIALRMDYIKRTRLMQVDINFEDLIDFSCEFGDLTSTRSPSDIHADLLSKAAQAGKSVASNASYWSAGSDKSNAIDVRLQQGLLTSNQVIKSIDGTQGVEIDAYGIHLYSYNNDGTRSDKQGWIINNQFLYSSDGFKTTESVFGEFQVDGQQIWGLLAKGVLAGYIEGSSMVGGTIKIGERGDGTYNFEVDENGIITMRGGTGAAGDISHIQSQVDGIGTQIDNIETQKMYSVKIISNDRNIMTRKNQTAELSCRVYSWDTDITDTLNSNIFSWVRTSDDENADMDWNNMPIHRNTKTLIISTEDIANNASFSCQVDLPD